MNQPSLAATLTVAPPLSGGGLAALPASVNWLEVRADVVGDLDPNSLRRHFKKELLYVLRSHAEGGSSLDSPEQRQRRLTTAARYYDRVELECERDLSAEVLKEIPAEKRVVSWHGSAVDRSELDARFQKMASTPAAFYKLVTCAEKMSDEFACLSFLKSLGRSDVIAYSTGPLGFWSRVMALHLGSPVIFGLVYNGPFVPGEPTIESLIRDYGLPTLPQVKSIFAILGNPIFHSLSPRLHNAAYRALNYPGMFLPLRVESFDEFWRDVVQANAFESLGFAFNGMTVASPHKEAAVLTASTVSPVAHRANSANILVRAGDHWSADTTDPEVIYMASRERNVQVNKRRAAVIGCGGAGRAMAAALAEFGADVTLVNRSPERGIFAADLLGLPYRPLAGFNPVGYDLIVNATPVGRENDDAPCEVENLNLDAAVIDLVYGVKPTSLIAAAKARQQIAIDGRDVLLTQVARQFRMMTGAELPEAVALEAIGRVRQVSDAVSLVQNLTGPRTIQTGADAN
jgi:3-dehydroquinate dehydratase/shikimate dehydrogenase